MTFSESGSDYLAGSRLTSLTKAYSSTLTSSFQPPSSASQRWARYHLCTQEQSRSSCKVESKPLSLRTLSEQYGLWEYHLQLVSQIPNSKARLSFMSCLTSGDSRQARRGCILGPVFRLNGKEAGRVQSKGFCSVGRCRDRQEAKYRRSGIHTQNAEPKSGHPVVSARNHGHRAEQLQQNRSWVLLSIGLKRVLWGAGPAFDN